MKIKSKILTLSVIGLFFLFTGMMVIGHTTITNILNEGNNYVFKKELEHIIDQITESHEVLIDSGLDDVESYLESAKKELADNINKTKYGISGSYIIFSPKEKNYVSHPDKLPGTPISPSLYTVSNRKINVRIYDSPIDFDGDSYYLYSSYFEPWDWQIVFRISNKEFYKDRDYFITNSLKIASIILILTVLVTMLFVKRITTPIKLLSDYSQEVKNGNYDLDINIKARDELGLLGSVFNDMVKSIKKYSHEMETIVSERTGALNRRNREIKVILEHVPLGIFMLNKERKILEEYSNYLTSILEQKKIESRKFGDLFAGKTYLGKDEEAQINEALMAILSESEICYELNEHLLPRNLIFKGRKDEKSLIIDWKPIVNHGLVENLLVVIKDNTEFEKIKLKDKDKSIERQVLQKFLNSNSASIETNFKVMNNILSYLCNINLADQWKNEKNTIKRQIHTLKGSARTFDMSDIAEVCHDMEDEIKQYDLNIIKYVDHFGSTLNYLKEKVLQYEDIFEKKIKSSQAQKTLSRILSVIKDLCQKLDAENNDKNLISNKLRSIIRENSDYIALKEFLETGLTKNANQLNKPAPKVIYIMKSFPDISQYLEVMQELLLHICNNSIDHGIESPEKRQLAGKEVQGKIFLKFELIKDKLHLQVWDDGLGLNCEKLKTIGKNRGVLSNNYSIEDVANLIFEEGLSSKSEDQISEISGRGIGMSALKEVASLNSWKIWLNLEIEHPIDINKPLPNIPFKIKIEIPTHSATNEKAA